MKYDLTKFKMASWQRFEYFLVIVRIIIILIINIIGMYYVRLHLMPALRTRCSCMTC